MVVYDVISTGSKGNAVVINNILIDCGVSFKALQAHYKNLQLVLLTHEHGDHFNATTIKKLAAERPTLRFGCCNWLVPDLLKCGVSILNIDIFEIGKKYNYGKYAVSPVKLYHDVYNCGYRVYFANGEKVFYATDTEHLDGITAKDYDLYMIEANYEEEELQARINEKLAAGQYSYEMNVASRHLSKKQADAFLLDNMGDKSAYVYLHSHEER